MSPATGTAESLLPATPAGLRRRLYVMMFLQYFIQGCYLPIISVYLQDALGFSAREIGLFGSALAIGPLLAPFILGQMVDRHFATERVLAFSHLAGGVLMVLLFVQTSLWPVLLLGTLYATLYVPSLMLTNSLTFHHLQDRDREFPLVRLWGTVGFVVPAWLIEVGFLRGLEGEALNRARGVALLLAGVSGLLMAAYSLTLPHTPPAKSAGGDLAPGRVLGMLRVRAFLVLVLISFLIAVVHKFYFVLNSPFLKAMLTAGGVAGAWEQRISSIGQISEVAVMAGLGLAIVRIGFKYTMLLGTLAYVLRCLIFAWTSTEPGTFAFTMTWICVGQALHGFCFGCFMAAAFMYVDRCGPPDVRGSMQNFYGTFVLGLGFVAGGVVAGFVGDVMTTAAGESTLRDLLGITATAGTMPAEIGTATLVRDWVGIWLSGAALAAVAMLAFAVLFPSATPAAGGSQDEPSSQD